MVLEQNEDISSLKVCLECNRQFTGIVCACPNDGSPLVQIMQDPLIGTSLAGKYDILAVIGHGGMGVVYKARDALMDRLVAIKMLKAQLISDSMSVKRFHQEGKAASRINHPHVITVHEFGISPSGQPFIVMDFLEGTSLAQVIKDDGHVGVERTVKILSQACDALNHAHRHGVVHRDLKPSNIVLITYDGQKDFVKVVDFGVAKLITGAGQDLQRLTQAGEVCGSPVYMSPEQCQGEELDARSDIYSLGVVLYETLTGKLPLIGQTMVETMSKHITDTAAPFNEARPDLYIPERLEAVVFKALSKDPDHRHATMTLLQQDLELAIPKPGRSQVLRSIPAESEPRSTGNFEAQVRPAKHPQWKVPISVTLILLCGVFSMQLGQWLRPMPRTTAPPAPAQSILEPEKVLTGKTAPIVPPKQVRPEMETVLQSTPDMIPPSEHLQHAGVKDIVAAPELAAPKLEQDGSASKLRLPKITPGSDSHKVAPRALSAFTATPTMRRAYSTAEAEQSLLRFRAKHRLNEGLSSKNHDRKSASHRPQLETAVKPKDNPDPFKELPKMYSYKHEW